MPQSRGLKWVNVMALLLMASSSFAEVTVAQYETMKDSQFAETYIAGLGDGISWAVVNAESHNQPKLFCQPSKLALNPRNYKDILDSFIASGAVKPEYPIGMVLMYGLQQTFPCK